MHRSQLSTFVFDTNAPKLEDAATFWQQAFGTGAAEVGPDGRYATLSTPNHLPVLMVQKVTHPSRIHVDVETDNVEAEVARLIKLGAKEVERIRTWVVMDAPSGHRFCVVRPQRGVLGPAATRWDDHGKQISDAAWKGSEHHTWLGLLEGRWSGKGELWFDPTQTPQTSEIEIVGESLLSGKFIDLRTIEMFPDRTQHGRLTVGYHRDANEFETTWIDSFGTGTAFLISRGKPQLVEGAAKADVFGTYLAVVDGVHQHWGWRTSISVTKENALIEMFNCEPPDDKHSWGPGQLAMRWNLQRQK